MSELAKTDWTPWVGWTCWNGRYGGSWAEGKNGFYGSPETAVQYGAGGEWIRPENPVNRWDKTWKKDPAEAVPVATVPLNEKDASVMFRWLAKWAVDKCKDSRARVVADYIFDVYGSYEGEGLGY